MSEGELYDLKQSPVKTKAVMLSENISTIFCKDAPLSSWAVAWSNSRQEENRSMFSLDISRSCSSQEPPPGATETTLSQIISQLTEWRSEGGNYVLKETLVGSSQAFLDESGEWDYSLVLRGVSYVLDSKTLYSRLVLLNLHEVVI